MEQVFKKAKWDDTYECCKEHFRDQYSLLWREMDRKREAYYEKELTRIVQKSISDASVQFKLGPTIVLKDGTRIHRSGWLHVQIKQFHIRSEKCFESEYAIPQALANKQSILKCIQLDLLDVCATLKLAWNRNTSLQYWEDREAYLYFFWHFSTFPKDLRRFIWVRYFSYK